MHRRLIVGTLFLGGLAGPALGYNEEQENVLKHVSEAMVIEFRCEHLSINTDLASLAGLMFGVPFHEASTQDALRERIVQVRADMDRHSDEIVCATGELLYGPDGMNVPNLLSAE